MQSIQKFIQKYFTKISFVLAILFFFFAGFSFFFTKQAGITKTIIHKVAGATVAITAIPTSTPTHSASSGSSTPIYTQTKTQVIPTATPVQAQQTNDPTSNTAAATQTSVPQQQTQQTVNLQISEPDGTSNFSLPVGGNACDELTEAKNEGKIRSVTFSDQYMSSMHSLYIKEINGYQNDWTFTVNGQGPSGCSLASPKAGDNVVWKFS